MSTESSDLEGQMRARQEAAAALRERGVNPYANDFRVSHKITDLPNEEGLPPEDGIAAESPRYATDRKSVV